MTRTGIWATEGATAPSRLRIKLKSRLGKRPQNDFIAGSAAKPVAATFIASRKSHSALGRKVSIQMSGDQS